MKKLLAGLLIVLIAVAGFAGGNLLRQHTMLADGASYRFSLVVPAADHSVAAATATPAADSVAGPPAGSSLTYEAVIHTREGSSSADIVNQVTQQSWRAEVVRSVGRGYKLIAPDRPTFTLEQSLNPLARPTLTTTPQEVTSHPEAAPSAPVSTPTPACRVYSGAELGQIVGRQPIAERGPAHQEIMYDKGGWTMLKLPDRYYGSGSWHIFHTVDCVPRPVLMYGSDASDNFSVARMTAAGIPADLQAFVRGLGIFP
ncbi:hypothetical protein ACI3QO_10605 [Propionibacterium freudenreichii]|uniref:Uncharacterized protein n=1 Tax=Propionibacterium freudenreichii TaxID=1744 RepID=A0A2C7AII0_9ACTN|nr:hypothetical protein [Propionibacterium freudenreichii]MDK9344701.1 hypothetical protein [Propionibacterium freudenreichii]MDK9669287.1 hypothetical protein [Propionibacterium freudenreichii]